MSPTPTKPAKHWSIETHSVRERFSLGVLGLAVTLAAACFAALHAMGFRAAAGEWFLPLQIWLFVLPVWVGLLQAIGRRWRRPRLVAMLAGALYLIGSLYVYMVIEQFTSWPPTKFVIQFAIVGMFIGYLAGTVVSSIFLIDDWLRIAREAGRFEKEELLAAVGEKPRESPFDD